jgi:hypothetical protein
MTFREAIGLGNPENRRALEKAERDMKPKAPEYSPAARRANEAFNWADATRREDFQEPTTKKSDKKSSTHSVVNQSRAAANVLGEGDTFENNYKKFYEQLTGASKEQLKGIKDLIASQAGEAGRIKEEALGRAISAFGFNMAAQGAKSGVARRGGIADIIQGAAAAAPTFNESLNESDRLARQAQKEQVQMNLDMAKYELAMKKGDQATAATLANQMEARRLQLKELGIKSQHYRDWANVMGQRAANAGGGNKMDIEVFKAMGVARGRAATHALNTFDKVYGGRVPKEYKDKGMTQEQFLNHLERQNLPRFLPGAMSAVSGDRAKNIDPDDIIDLGD